MDDKELFETWKSDDNKEKQTQLKHQGEYLEIAKRKGDDVFRRIKRNIIIEGVTSVIPAAFFLFLLSDNMLLFQMIILLMISAVAVSIFVIGTYFRDLKKLNEQSIVESLKMKLNILSRYTKQQNFYGVLFAFLGFTVAFSVGLIEEGEFSSKSILLRVAFALPFLLLLVWLVKKYVYQLYGKHLKNVEEIYNNLTQD